MHNHSKDLTSPTVPSTVVRPYFGIRDKIFSPGNWTKLVEKKRKRISNYHHPPERTSTLAERDRGREKDKKKDEPGLIWWGKEILRCTGQGTLVTM